MAIRDSIDTREGSAAAKFFRRSMLAQGAYQVDSASERIRLGLDRARATGKRVGRPPALSHEQVEQCRRMVGEGSGLRQIARVSMAAAKWAIDSGQHYYTRHNHGGHVTTLWRPGAPYSTTHSR